MRTARITAIAGALVFFELMATQAMAEPPQRKIVIDPNKCDPQCVGKACPCLFVDHDLNLTIELRYSKEQWDVFRQARKLEETPEAPPK